MKAKKDHQRPELQKVIDFINIQCKIINKWKCNTKKNNSAYSLVPRLYETIEFSSTSFPKLK